MAQYFAFHFLFGFIIALVYMGVKWLTIEISEFLAMIIVWPLYLLRLIYRGIIIIFLER